MRQEKKKKLRRASDRRAVLVRSPQLGFSYLEPVRFTGTEPGQANHMSSKPANVLT